MRKLLRLILWSALAATGIVIAFVLYVTIDMEYRAYRKKQSQLAELASLKAMGISEADINLCDNNKETPERRLVACGNILIHDGLNRDQRIYFLFRRAESFQRLRDYQREIDDYSQILDAVRRDPRHGWNHWYRSYILELRGDAFSKIGDFKNAVHDFDEAFTEAVAMSNLDKSWRKNASNILKKRAAAKASSGDKAEAEKDLKGAEALAN